MTFCNYSVRFGVRFVSLVSAPQNFPTRWLLHLVRFRGHACGGPSCGTPTCASPHRQHRSKWDSPKSDRFLPLYFFLSRPLGLFYFVLCMDLRVHLSRSPGAPSCELAGSCVTPVGRVVQKGGAGLFCWVFPPRAQCVRLRIWRSSSLSLLSDALFPA